MNSQWLKLSKTARQAVSQGNYSYAETTWMAALQEAEDFASTDDRLIQTLDGLTEAFRKQGKFRQAEKYARRLLDICRELNGNDHLKSAVAAHNLAIIYHMQQKYGQAEPLYKQALTIKTRILGPSEPAVIQLLHSYSELLKMTHRDAEAENLIRCAQSANPSSETIGSKRVTSLINQAPSWSRQSPSDAPPQASAIKQPIKTVKPTHQAKLSQSGAPIVHSSAVHESITPLPTPFPVSEKTWEDLQQAAEGAFAAGQIDSALELWNQAILIAETYPASDSRLARSLDRIGEVFFSIEKYGQAEMSWWRSLQIKQAVLGNFHPAVAQTTNYLAKLHYLLGRYSEAETYAKRCIEVYQRCLGREHSTVATCRHNLASLYHIQGRYADAEDQYKIALQLRTKLLGLQHPDTLSITKSYADLLKTLGREAEAQHLNSTSNGFVSGSWKAIVVPENQALLNPADVCMFCGARLEGLSTCSACQTRRGMPF
ncbi:MAG: tetratricopeptide repeat protein [Candidatus Melainabacteria bacterium]|nr:tetratricopeptide repeat protein [Candidatus Melainabacteria bacterium]